MLASLVMILAAFGWAFGNIGAKAALGVLQPQTFLAVRFAAAVILLWLVLVLSGRLHRLSGVRRGQVLLGICEPFIQNGLTAVGLGFVPGNHAVVLWGLMPVVAPLLSRVILKEPLSRAVSAGAVLAIAGALVLVLGGEFTTGSLLGDGLIVASILLACFTQILSRHMASGGSDPVVTSTIQLTTSTVLAGLTWAALLPFTDASAGPQPTTMTWVLAAAVGVIGSALPFICYHYAMRTMSVGRTALFVPLVAPLGTALSGLWLGEALGLNVYVALVLTLGGVMLPTLAQRLARRPA
jgi:drug/metabolite transporter (DMT)-like permease